MSDAVSTHNSEDNTSNLPVTCFSTFSSEHCFYLSAELYFPCHDQWGEKAEEVKESSGGREKPGVSTATFNSLYHKWYLGSNICIYLREKH